MTIYARWGWALVTVCSAWLAGGCAPSNVQLTSYKDPYFPESVGVALADCAYYADRSGDIHIAGRARLRPADPAATREFVLLHIYWRPQPGKTPSDPSTMDALVRYVLVNESGAAVYSGTGFAYPDGKTGYITVSVESSELQLVARRGTLDDALGNLRLVGVLHPRPDDVLTANIRREAELYGGQ